MRRGVWHCRHSAFESAHHISQLRSGLVYVALTERRGRYPKSLGPGCAMAQRFLRRE